MRNVLITIVVLLGIFALGAKPEPPTTNPPLPAGHPATPPTLPQGHPVVVAEPPTTPGASDVQADPADVASVESILEAYYASISGPAGQPRDWERFKTLFMADSRFITLRPAGEYAIPMSLTPDQYIEINRTYFERGGYFEEALHNEVDSYGKIAQVFSTYATWRNRQNPDPYGRGINSFQLLNDGQRWWIVTVMWETEIPDQSPIPAVYLPVTNGE